MNMDTVYALNSKEEQLLEDFAKNGARLSYDDVSKLFAIGVTDYDVIAGAMNYLNGVISEMAKNNSFYVPADYNYNEQLGSFYTGEHVCKTFEEAKECGTTIIIELLYGSPVKFFYAGEDELFVETSVKGHVKLLLSLNNKEDK